jgi:hypothetical protein
MRALRGEVGVGTSVGVYFRILAGDDNRSYARGMSVVNGAKREILIRLDALVTAPKKKTTDWDVQSRVRRPAADGR